MLGDDGLHVVVADVDGEQPERADVARVRGHERARQVEDVHQPAGQQRAGAAERGEREVADVEALGDGHLAQRVGLVPRGDLEDAGGHPLQGEVELRAELGQAVDRRLDRQRDLAAQQVRGDPAEGDVGVGDGGLVAAVRVAHRAGVGAGRLGADLERALGGEPGDRAAARADGDDVDHRDLRRVVADRALGGERRLAVDDHGDVGRGAAAVAGEDPVEARGSADQRRAQGAGGRAGQHRGDRLVHDLAGRQHAAVALHHVERHAGGDLVEAGADVGDVGADLGLHRGVDERGHRALVLAVLAQHLARDARRRRRGAPPGSPRASAARGRRSRRRAGSRRRSW